MTNKILGSLALLGLIGFVTGGTIALVERPARATPFFERISGTQCVTKYPTNAWHRYSVGSSTPAQVEFVQGQVGYFLCPVPDKTSLPYSDISTVEAYVSDQNDNGTTQSASYQVVARACSVSPGGFAGCGAGFYSTGTGIQPLTLTGSYLDEIDHYNVPYLYISVPPLDVAPSAILGVYYSKNF